jgi:RNA polymerase-associated protein CTR9
MYPHPDEMAAAIHTLDTLLQPPNPQRSTEATVMLASLRAHPRPGVSSSDVAQERIKARELFDRVSKEIGTEDSRANGQAVRTTSRSIADDQDMHIEIARLWQTESLERTGKALQEAHRIGEASGKVDPRLLNNLGVLNQLEQRFSDARLFYEKALISASSGSDPSDNISTTILYNLARVYEDQGEESLAKDAYDKLISRHPEYVDGRS